MKRTAIVGLVAALLLGGGLFGQDDPASPESQPTNPKVEMITSKGAIILELFPESAPIGVENFLKYVDDGFYDGLLFHRVISGFMLPGGAFNQAQEDQQPTYGNIAHEADNGLRNKRGTVSYARQTAPGTASSQFFINHADNPSLDFDGPYGGYAVFGQVVEGMNVVDAIAAVRVQRGSISEAVPLEPVVIERVRRVDPSASSE
jgi:cyclophilin family peptidyl-prolyl cis-trans isomerase